MVWTEEEKNLALEFLLAEYAMVQSMLPDGMTLQEVIDDCYHEGE